jgi:PAS domain S-box-containing protein
MQYGGQGVGCTNILIIEQAPPGRQVTQKIRAMLGSGPFAIASAENASTEPLFPDRGKADVAVVNIDRADGRGIATLREIRTSRAPVPVIALISEKRKSVAGQAMLEGAQLYLVRESITANVLLRAFRYAIERHRIDLKSQQQQERLATQAEKCGDQLKESQERLKKEREAKNQKGRGLKKTTRLLRVIKECNQARNHAKSEGELLTWICEVLVFTGQYPYVWVGYADKKTNMLRPVAYAGFTRESLESAEIIRSDTVDGTGPGSIARKTKKLHVIQKLRTGTNTAQNAEARRMGYASAMSIPILNDREQATGGALVILSSTDASFDPDERRLLVQLADDISCGIRALHTSEAHSVAEEALHDSEMFYRTLINTLPVGIMVVDTDDQIEFLSKKIAEMLRLPNLQDGLGSRFERWFSPEHQETAHSHHRAIVTGAGVNGPREYHLVRFDGSNFWGELRTAALRDAQEQVIETLIVTQDVSDRKEADRKLHAAYADLERRVEERTADLVSSNAELMKEVSRREQLMSALKESEQTLRNKQRLLDTAEKLAHIGSWEWDFATGTERWSEEEFRIFGYEPQSIRPTNRLFRSLVHPDDRALVGDRTKLTTDVKETFDVTFRILRPDGSIRYVHSIGELKRNQQGIATGIRGSTQDVTEQKKAEEEMARLATIVAHSDDAIIGLNPDATIFSWNAGAEKIFGYSFT